MLTTAYVLTTALAGLLMAVHCVVPALIVAGVAMAIVFRREVARLIRSLATPRVRTDP